MIYPAAVLAYFAAGAFVGGVVLTAFGKMTLGVMGLITGDLCYKISNIAKVKGYNIYADILEFGSYLLKTYAFDELLQGISEGFSSLKEKLKSTDLSQLRNKKGYIDFSGSSGNSDVIYDVKGHNNSNRSNESSTIAVGKTTNSKPSLKP
ncbi:MAG: hypothetical protein MJZ34_16080 [Paludibacteraceae bacterium]|nr:hypothetical protein [Paludibacteraceae bacterium]